MNNSFLFVFLTPFILLHLYSSSLPFLLSILLSHFPFFLGPSPPPLRLSLSLSLSLVLWICSDDGWKMVQGQRSEFCWYRKLTESNGSWRISSLQICLNTGNKICFLLTITSFWPSGSLWITRNVPMLGPYMWYQKEKQYGWPWVDLRAPDSKRAKSPDTKDEASMKA